MGRGPQARGEGAPLPPAPAPAPAPGPGPGPGPLPGAHSLHAGVRVWEDLSQPLSCVPRGSGGRGPRGLPGALTDPEPKKRKYAAGEKAGRGPASFRLCQSAAGIERLFHQFARHPRLRLSWCSAFLVLTPHPACETWGSAARGRPQTGGYVYKVREQRKETICSHKLSLGDRALSNRITADSELGTRD